MKNPNSTPRVVVSSRGDVLLIQGSETPILFIPHTQVSELLEAPETAVCLMILNIGAAAVETMIAANATFEAEFSELNGAIESATLTFRLPNGLLVAYTTDDCAETRHRLAASRIQLVITSDTLDWNPKHAEFVGSVISRFPLRPPQLPGLNWLNTGEIKKIVVQAITDRVQANWKGCVSHGK